MHDFWPSGFYNNFCKNYNVLLDLNSVRRQFGAIDQQTKEKKEIPHEDCRSHSRGMRLESDKESYIFVDNLAERIQFSERKISSGASRGGWSELSWSSGRVSMSSEKERK